MEISNKAHVFAIKELCEAAELTREVLAQYGGSAMFLTCISVCLVVVILNTELQPGAGLGG